MPNLDVAARMNTAIQYFQRYKQMMGGTVPAGDPVDTYVAEAQEGIKKEEKRLERQREGEQSATRQRAAKKVADDAKKAAAEKCNRSGRSTGSGPARPCGAGAGRSRAKKLAVWKEAADDHFNDSPNPDQETADDPDDLDDDNRTKTAGHGPGVSPRAPRRPVGCGCRFAPPRAPIARRTRRFPRPRPRPAQRRDVSGARRAAETPDAPKVKVERGTGGHKVYRITEEIRIEGKNQESLRPSFSIRKSSINYDWQELKQDFHPQDPSTVFRRHPSRQGIQPMATQAAVRGAQPQAGAAPKVKILRIGIIQGGRIVEERLVRKRENITIGQSAKNLFVVPSEALPRRWQLLFEISGNYWRTTSPTAWMLGSPSATRSSRSPS